MLDTLQDLDPRVLAAALQIARLCIWLVLLAVVFLPLERLFALHPSKIFRKDVGADVVYYFLSSLTPAIFLSIPLACAAWAAHHFQPAVYASWTARMPLLVRVAGALVIGELGFYWGHRWTHEIPLLWRFHALHHSAEHMDFLVNTKAHPVDVVFTRLCGLVPLYVFGFAAPVRGAAGTVPLLVILVGTVWGFFIHSNLRWRLGPVETLVATPAFHHWHHTNDGADVLNKNYAALLPFLDRVFGTLYLPVGRHPVRYGIDEQLPSGVVGQLLQPFGLGLSRSEANKAKAATEQ